MPLPLIPIIGGIATLITGGYGVAKGAKAISDNKTANNLNDYAKALYNRSKWTLEKNRDITSTSLKKLGEKKISCLNITITKFLNIYNKIQNIGLAKTDRFDDLSKFKIDKQGAIQLKELTMIASSMVAGTATGAIAGSAVAFGAYGAAGALATASTGTAIATLSGAAATNATLAFFGGGAIAAGGLGIAGGTAVLGGIVAGPALAILGTVMGAKASANLDDARSNKAMAEKAAAEIDVLVTACKAIEKRSNLFNTLLVKTEMRMIKLLMSMEAMIASEGTDYTKYSLESQELCMVTLATAKAMKALLCSPLLDEKGALLEDSLNVANAVQKQLQ